MSTTELRKLVTGPVIGPEDAEYEDARHVYNFMIEARPEAIVRCASAEDAQAAVSHAVATGRGVAVRGGGHSVPGFGTADDAIVVDLSGLTRVEVDPVTRTAKAGGGAETGGCPLPQAGGADAGCRHGPGRGRRGAQRKARGGEAVGSRLVPDRPPLHGWGFRRMGRAGP